MNYPRYPEYKPSGVEWLGEVPAHWVVASLRWVTHRYTGGTPDRSNEAYWDGGDIPWINSGAVNQGLITEPSAFITQDGFVNSSAKWVPKDVVVMALAGQGKTKGMVAQLGVDATCNQSMAAIIPDERVVSRFLYWWLTAQYEPIRNLAGSEQREGLNLDLIGSLPIVLFPTEDQHTIAAFLDRETARIDALIAKKQRLIELLAEKRTALISQAVTKGLNPDAPMKDSGVEWLGEIPAHWQANRLKFVLAFPLKYGANESAELDDPVLPRYIRITDIDEQGNLRDDTFKSLPEEVARPYLLEDGDLLLARSGATVGKTFLYHEDWGRAAYAGYLIRARFDGRKYLARFATYVTQSRQYWGWLGSSFIQATIQNVSAEKYANFVMPFPPINEQQEVVAFLDSETSKLNSLCVTVELAVDRLREYRAALIADAVTGKIDVCNLAEEKEVA